MKKIILFVIGCLLFSFSIFAQKSGVITYEMTVNLQAALSPAQKMFKAMIPKEKVTKVKVYFNENHAKIEVQKEEEEGKGMVMMSMGDDAPVYLNLKDKTRIEILELDDEYYGTPILLEIPELSIEGKTKNYLDYKCVAFEQTDEVKVQTSVKTDDKNSKKQESDAREDMDNKATIWVATELPQGISPMGETFWNGTLMGYESTLISYEVIDISFEEIADETVQPGTEFKEVTQEQMEDLQEEKMESIIGKFRG